MTGWKLFYNNYFKPICSDNKKGGNLFAGLLLFYCIFLKVYGKLASKNDVDKPSGNDNEFSDRFAFDEGPDGFVCENKFLNFIV